MTDLWIIEEKLNDNKKAYYVFESEKEATDSLEIGNYLFKVPAERIVFLGECKLKLEK